MTARLITVNMTSVATATLSPVAAEKIALLSPDHFGHAPGGSGGTHTGTDADDTMSGSFRTDDFHGGAGNDTFNWSAGGDSYFGDGGTDTVNYQAATSAIDVDLVRDQHGSAGAGALGAAAGDTFDGIENITGSAFADTIKGDAHDNRIDGGDGADNLFGGAGNDVIIGGKGDDHLAGGTGADILTGGWGTDTFAFNSVKDGGDHITDFEHAEIWWNVMGQSGHEDISDRIEISRKGFGLSDSFAFNDQTFHSGDHVTAQGSGPQFLYDTVAHTLSYDANGAAAGGVTVLATFDNGEAIHLSDMFLV